MEIKEEVVRHYCNKYGFICDDFWGKLRVRTKHDIFYIVSHDGMIRLYHENRGVRNTRKGINYHFQRDFWEYDDLFFYISDHDQRFHRYTKKVTHFKSLLSQIQEELHTVEA